MEASLKKLSPALQLGFAGLVVAGLVALAVLSTPVPSRTGDLPQAQLVRLDGATKQLQTGKPTVVTVWVEWCSFCQRQLPEFEQVARQRTDVHFAFVNDGEPATVVRRFLEASSYRSAAIYQDVQREVSRKLRVQGYPSNFFYNSRGELVNEVRGYMGVEQLRRALERLD
ncbi:TlpA disulfide reductase family protein [uncultured Meiothermus sp.]|uniref:TlpA family protein disulfide reductase n=1 Tax=uncultured Meiothermus sp. TaxID=157471 RepID=UPI00262DE741|nr:TlpA disulfide reductase family protein [uncultured Meiothermus sp.]